MLDILVIAPHPDDAELGMAGAILKFMAEGRRVGVLDLTSGEPTPHGSPEIRARETAAATKILGLAWRENLGLPNRSLEPTLEARAKLAGVIRREKPRWLFAPYWVDAHPDHVAATELVEAARFWAKLTKTDLPGEPHHPQRIYNYYCIHLKQALAAGVRARHQRALGAEAGGDPRVREPVHRRPQRPEPPTFLDQLRDEAVVLGQDDRRALRRAVHVPRAAWAAVDGRAGLTVRGEFCAGSGTRFFASKLPTSARGALRGTRWWVG